PARHRRMTAGRRMRPPSQARLRRIRLLVLDVDGVLTDGRFFLGPDEGEWKSFHVHDGLALVRAVAARFPVAIVSSRSAPAVARRCGARGVAGAPGGVADKLPL